jgi:heme oxygenase
MEQSLRVRKIPVYQCSSHVGDTFSSLSTRLREETAELHRRIEALMQLPRAIEDMEDYRAWLCRYLGFYEPLERCFSEFSGWELLGIELARCAQAGCLRDDVAALGVDQEAIPRVSPMMLPQLPSFAHALGSLYVVEGAKLGGRSILRQLERQIGSEIVGARCFFSGGANAGGLPWQSFRTALDEFGQRQPQLCADAVIGAKRTFISMENWFAPFCAGISQSHELI